MKIGIITYWQSNDNYGQLLQCYALQRYFVKMGHEPFLIRYDVSNRYSANNKWKKVLKILMVYPVLLYLLNKKKKGQQTKLLAEISKKNSLRKFDDFRKQMILQSSQLYSSLKEMQQNPPQADWYVTGSDQVWSQLLNNKENEAFFLNFGDNNIKRISYAASFAMDEYPQKLHKELKANLNRFQAISVREKTGIDICSNVGVSAEVVVDPTLLLDNSVYRKIASNKKYNNYIYVYSLNISSADEMYFDEIKQLASKQGCEIIVTPASGCVPGLELFGNVTYDYATIPEWIANIDNAEVVITTSFHGIVFCLLMHTQFVYIPLKDKLAKMNNRILNLLEALGLEDMIAFSANGVERIVKRKINWENIEQRLSVMRDSSISFLNNNVK